MRQGRWIAALLLGVSAGPAITGCFTGGINQVPGHESLATDLTAEATPRVTRSQQLDPSDPRYRPQVTAPLIAAPPPPPTDQGTKQVSLTAAKSVRVSVRAWVNGRPIFDDEVMQAIPPSVLRDLSRLREPQRSERVAEIYNQVLDGIIDQEVCYQDAMHRLEPNKKVLGNLKKYVNEEFEKQMKKIRDTSHATEEQIKEIEPGLRRHNDRKLISDEYLRSRILPIADQRANAMAVKEYYDTHRNEFNRLDTVQWQDVFIAVSPKCPTVAHARRFAEDLIVQCRTAADFAKLIQYDEGDSKFRNGEGTGAHRGEIKPPELEETLFRLKEGQIGPVIELSTGVHIVRVTKREYAGVIPLDEKTQKLIQNKIKNQVFETEVRRIIRELRNRATIEIERE